MPDELRPDCQPRGSGACACLHAARRGGAEELPEHSLELGNLTIRAGEELSYTVVDAQFEADVAAGSMPAS